MFTLLSVSLLFSSFFSLILAENLTCACSKNICGKLNVDFCVVDSPNSFCIASIRQPPGSNETTLERRCSNDTDTQSSNFCNTSSSTLATVCCTTHFCNFYIQPELTNRTPPNHTVIKPTLNPGPGEPTTEDPTDDSKEE